MFYYEEEEPKETTSYWVAPTESLITANGFIIEPFKDRAQVIDAYAQAFFGQKVHNIGSTQSIPGTQSSY